MLAEAKRKALEHERISRASEGQSQVPLQLRLKVALPLAALAIAIYSFSFLYARRRWNMPIGDEQNFRILQDIRGMPRTVDDRGTQEEDSISNEGELLTDEGKKW